MAGKRTVLTVRLRRLAAMLGELRENSGLSKEEVSSRTGINVTTLYRIETAQARPQRRTLTAMLDLYGIGEPQRSDALQLLTDALKPGMARPFEAAVGEVYGAYINFEAEALSARFFQASYIPGLLQTEEYADAVMQTSWPKISDEVRSQRVRARVERAKVLTKEEPLELWVVLDEAVIRRMVGGPEVMIGQLQRLLNDAAQRNVILQLLPFDAGAHPGMSGSFVVLDFQNPADPELVYVEGIASDEIIEGHSEVRRYGVMFDQLRAMALSPRNSEEVINQVIEELRQST
ncbi:helix-turn-helix domain-containing protein [Nocardia otitidiscaviarum]|uniref:Helix-turn-helix domain-containing protein n=1 Tax=Nocardia otitidiscaviarum TaxID=1823 RepID=A0A516NPI5_9NOCA|nr:helix-turn-helix transcriptional regulator [Nocardia otitidiscaviarum]MBF6182540.1 helix-turn-helix domain-containing protein [Nocardia otitidiscaviarum]MCP9623902.1 helix-turn-helix domain-containing protein [Nocardia otitidiscaviarum]QDP80810.1 helix-turn-helix domain-containing protein [Nocardia otitidiscaviarum]